MDSKPFLDFMYSYVNNLENQERISFLKDYVKCTSEIKNDSFGHSEGSCFHMVNKGLVVRC